LLLFRYTYSYENNRLWRKNRVETSNNNCIGIDLNRNWNYDWHRKNSDKNYCSACYQGPTPNSELEIKAIIQFITNNLTKIKVSSHLNMKIPSIMVNIDPNFHLMHVRDSYVESLKQ